jgi:hypothetical protein
LWTTFGIANSGIACAWTKESWLEKKREGSLIREKEKEFWLEQRGTACDQRRGNFDQRRKENGYD